MDRARLLADVSTVIGDACGNISSVGTRTDRNGIATLRFVVEVGDVSSLDSMLHMIHRVDGVLDARRALPSDVGGKKHRGR